MEINIPPPSVEAENVQAAQAQQIATASGAQKETYQSPADNLLRAMQEMGDFYRTKKEAVKDKYSQQTLENLAKKADLQAREFAYRLDHAAQLAVDIQAARKRAGSESNFHCVVNVLLSPQQPTEEGFTGWWRRFNEPSEAWNPLVSRDVTVGPDELSETFSMGEIAQQLAQEGEDHFLRQVGVIGPNETEASLYMGPNPKRVQGGSFWNQLEEIEDQVGDVKGKIIPIVSRGIINDAKGAIGTLPDNPDIKFLTWQNKAAVHFRLGEGAITEAIGARMPKPEVPAVTPSTPVATPAA